MSHEDDLDFLDLPEFLTSDSPVRCGTFLGLNVLPLRQIRANKFRRRFMCHQAGRFRAGKALHLPESLLNQVKRMALEEDVGEGEDSRYQGPWPRFI